MEEQSMQELKDIETRGQRNNKIEQQKDGGTNDAGIEGYGTEE